MLGLWTGAYVPCRCSLEQLGEEPMMHGGLSGGQGLERKEGAEMELPMEHPNLLGYTGGASHGALIAGQFCSDRAMAMAAGYLSRRSNPRQTFPEISKVTEEERQCDRSPGWKIVLLNWWILLDVFLFNSSNKSP